MPAGITQASDEAATNAGSPHSPPTVARGAVHSPHAIFGSPCPAERCYEAIPAGLRRMLVAGRLAPLRPAPALERIATDKTATAITAMTPRKMTAPSEPSEPPEAVRARW